MNWTQLGPPGSPVRNSGLWNVPLTSRQMNSWASAQSFSTTESTVKLTPFGSASTWAIHAKA